MCITFCRLRLFISGLLFIWHLTLLTLFLVRCFVCGSHFLTCAFVLHDLSYGSVTFENLVTMPLGRSC